MIDGVVHTHVPRGLFADTPNDAASVFALQVRDGVILDAVASANSSGLVALPQLIEAHCHLDKCHTAHRLGDIGGDLMNAILAQRSDKSRWTADDLRQRMTRGMAELVANGCSLARSHIDWGDEIDAPVAWKVAQDLEPPDGLKMQWAALTGIAQMADKDTAIEIARQIAATPAGVLGTFILDHDIDQVDHGLRNMFDVASQFGLMLDFHVDEGLGQSNGLERIADKALETGFDTAILCGHAVTLINQGADDVARIADKLARANISVCALPTTNLYLQGRNGGTPDRRGLTRLNELHAAGVNVVIGSDNVADAFCPTGAHDPMAALNLGVLAAHLDPPLDRWVATVTSNAARALGHETQQLIGGALKDLRVFDTASLADVVAGRASRLTSNEVLS